MGTTFSREKKYFTEELSSFHKNIDIIKIWNPNIVYFLISLIFNAEYSHYHLHFDIHTILLKVISHPIILSQCLGQIILLEFRRKPGEVWATQKRAQCSPVSGLDWVLPPFCKELCANCTTINPAHQEADHLEMGGRRAGSLRYLEAGSDSETCTETIWELFIGSILRDFPDKAVFKANKSLRTVVTEKALRMQLVM